MQAREDKAVNLSEGIPDHEDEAEPDNQTQDNGVTPLAEIDPVHQVVDHRKLIG